MRTTPLSWWVIAVSAAVAAPASAQLDRIFSVAPGGPSGLLADRLYQPTGVGVPLVRGGGGGMGLGLPGDDLDGFNLRILFSDLIICEGVDPKSSGKPQGAPPPGLPVFNLNEQFLKNQWVADSYLSSEAYNRFAKLLPPPISIGAKENYLRINQHKVYNADYDVLPAVGPEVIVPFGTPQDDIDSACDLVGGAVPPLYFSVTATSPSLPFLAGGVGESGADIFFDADATVGGDESLFAKWSDLKLLKPDEIDAVGVYDDNANGLFDFTDQVLFSLAPGSPTLALLGASAADILSVTVGPDGPIEIFAFANDLGLLHSDNINQLAFIRLENQSAYDTIKNLTPAPGTISLLALGLAAAGRRRR